MKKRILSIMLFMSITVLAMGCAKKESNKTEDQNNSVNEVEVTDNQAVTPEPTQATEPTQDAVTLFIAAAASMQPSLEELKSTFEDQYPWITIESTYDSSGKLQTQIEEGMEADIFLSAGAKQMDALKENNFVDANSAIDLLENEIVLIVPTGVESKVTGFEDILNADSIAIGDSASVPAGQYAKEILEHLGTYTQVEEKASLGSNVTEVLNWVSEGSADVGIVYATDAATTDKVTVIATAPAGSLEKPVIYPIGIVSQSKNKEAAQLYIDFLQSEQGKSLFENYGFKTK